MNPEDIDFATMTAYQLIEMLDAAYPHQCILPHETEAQARQRAGRRELIDDLVLAMNDELNARSE